MINIYSFFRKKRNIYFLLIILLITLFNCFIYYKYDITNKEFITNNDIFLIIDSEVLGKIKINKKNYKITEAQFLDLEKIGINVNQNKKYLIVTFDKISLYEKYKDLGILYLKNNIYNDIVNNLNFYRIISLILIAISSSIIIVIMFIILYYEKDTIKLLHLVGYTFSQECLIYFVNIFLLLLPSILLIIITGLN